MIFSKEIWAKVGEGFFVKDCTIGSEEGRLGFLFVETGNLEYREDWWLTRLVAVKLALPVDRRFYMREGGNLGSATLSSAWAPDQSEFIAVDIDRNCWSYKPKEYKGSETPIPFDSHDHDYDAAVTKVVRVGTTVYAIGAAFRIFTRIAGQKMGRATRNPDSPTV